jgi:peptidoglycan hydrolase CwlO-like protein
MSETAVAAAIAGGDLTGIGALLLIFVVVVIPFIVKFWNWSKEASAQGMLYQQLSEMVQTQRKELDDLYDSWKRDQEEIFELRHKVDNLEKSEQLIETLKVKLDEKDRIIAERDSRIAGLLQDLLQMKDRVHKLEIRLKADENKWCDNCEFKNTQYVPPLLQDEGK